MQASKFTVKPLSKLQSKASPASEKSTEAAARGRLRQLTTELRVLEAKLRAAFDSHPNVGEIRGRGLLWALELVADRETKRSFEPDLMIHARLKRNALDCGLICYPTGGTADGVRGDHVLLAPPYILEPTQVEELVQKLTQALEVTLRELPGERAAAQRSRS